METIKLRLFPKSFNGLPEWLWRSGIHRKSGNHIIAFLKKFRAFPADGDSMPPYKNGTYIVGKYVENLSDLKTDRTYVFITINDGISYKRFQFHEADGIWVKADNQFYEPYKIPLPEIKEIWEFACSINTKEYEPDEFVEHHIQNFITEIKTDIKQIKEKWQIGIESILSKWHNQKLPEGSKTQMMKKSRSNGMLLR